MSKQSDERERQAAGFAKVLREIADDPALADTPLPDRLQSTIRGACGLVCTLDPGSRVVTGCGSRVVTGYYTPTAPNVLSMTLREAHENLLRLLGALPRKGNEAARLRTLADGLPGGQAPDGAGKSVVQDSDVDKQQARNRAKMKWLSEAMTMVAQRGKLMSDAAIARLVGKHPSTLSRNKTYQRAAEAAREGLNITGGSKDRDGNLEVEAE